MSLKFQRSWPPVRRETIEEIEEEAAQYRAIPTSGFKSTKSRPTLRASSGSRPRTATLREQFEADMARAFSEEDQLEVYWNYVGRVRHGKAGYGGQPEEKAEEIVLRMWQEYLGDSGVSGSYDR